MVFGPQFAAHADAGTELDARQLFKFATVVGPVQRALLAVAELKVVAIDVLGVDLQLSFQAP